MVPYLWVRSQVQGWMTHSGRKPRVSPWNRSRGLLCLAIRATGEVLQLAPKDPVMKEVDAG